MTDYLIYTLALTLALWWGAYMKWGSRLDGGVRLVATVGAVVGEVTLWGLA